MQGWCSLVLKRRSRVWDACILWVRQERDEAESRFGYTISFLSRSEEEIAMLMLS